MAIPDQSDCLNQLLSRSWSEYDRVKDCDYVVQQAIPILFFGDSKRYFSSPCRVVTVGLNPSSSEFPDPDRFRRFPSMNGVAADPTKRTNSCHLVALDSYFSFRCSPYKQWFASFEPILTGMGCSFYDGCENTALHTDLCSPVATRPTWSGLSPFQRAHLESEGIKLWHSLMRVLAPDILVLSVAQRYLQLIEFRRLGPSHVIWKVDRSRPYEVLATRIEITPTRSSLLVFGKAAQKPFGTISNPKKEEMGAKIKEYYHAAAR